MTQLIKSSHGPRELFSISQVEKAFGPGYEEGSGCLRSWGERYLSGLKEPELSYEEALALPHHEYVKGVQLTQAQRDENRVRSSFIAKSFGKALEAKADQYIRGEPVDFTDEPGRRFFPGAHLLPHPSTLEAYQLQAPVNVKLFAPESAEPISFQGFKDARFLPRGSGPQGWFLFDYKTTKPKVDNEKNRELGKPQGWWTWQKTHEQLRRDYQWNLYQWDEYAKLERLVPSRWVYFASQDTPQARAVDIVPTPADVDSVRAVVTHLARLGNVLRGYIRDYRKGLPVDQLPRNTSNCQAYGRVCQYHRSQPQGTCPGGDDELIPVGQLLAKPGVVTVRDFQITEFQLTTGAQTMGTLRDQINAATQQQQAQGNGAPPPMQGPPAGAPPQGFNPQGAPPAQASFPSGYQGQPFAPAQGQPGFGGAPQGSPAPHVGAPEGWQQAPAPQGMPVQQQAPQAAPPPAQAPAAPPAYGSPSAAVQGWYNDGQGGVINAYQIQQHAQAGFPPAVALMAADSAAQQAQGATGTATQTAPAAGANGAAGPTGEAPKKRGRKSNAERAAAAAGTETDTGKGPILEAPETEEDADDLAAIGMLVVTLVRAVLGYGKQG